MNLGCHCVLFGPRIVEDAGTIMPALAKSGASGVEMGARFLNPQTRDTVMQALTESGMTLAGFHVSAPLVSLVDSYAEVEKAVQDACVFLSDKPYKNIIFTGMHLKDIANPQKGIDPRINNAKFVNEIALAFEKLAQFANANGVRLNYHNHSWEFENDALIYNALLQKAPTLNFAMDIGWAQSSGWNVEACIKKHKGRFNYLHLRDYKKADVENAKTFEQRQNAYCELGEGDAFNWPVLLPVLAQAAGKNGWLVVEYEKGEQDPARYEKAITFLQKTMPENNTGEADA